MGFYSGPVIVTDSLVFNFDAGNDKCTDADDDLASMRDIGPVAHSSRTDRSVHADGANGTGNITFPTNTGATKAINTSVSGHALSTDADDYDNRIDLDDDLYFADNDAFSFEFWGKLDSASTNTFHSMAGRGATTPWLSIIKGSDSSWDVRFRATGGTYYISANQSTNPEDWHQIVICYNNTDGLKYYIDGVNVLTNGGAASHTIPNSEFRINRIMAGYSSGGNKFGWQGSMLCTRAYAKTLSAAEVLQNFNATRRRVGI